MAKMTERALRARDAKRNLGAELLASVRQMKAGKVGRVQRVTVSGIAEARGAFPGGFGQSVTSNRGTNPPCHPGSACPNARRPQYHPG